MGRNWADLTMRDEAMKALSRHFREQRLAYSRLHTCAGKPAQAFLSRLLRARKLRQGRCDGKPCLRGRRARPVSAELPAMALEAEVACPPHHTTGPVSYRSSGLPACRCQAGFLPPVRWAVRDRWVHSWRRWWAAGWVRFPDRRAGRRRRTPR